MSGPLNMSEASTGSSLVVVKRARQQIEQDAQLLSNRIKFLQSEEAKTKRRIEEAKRKTDLILKAQERKETERQERDRIKSEGQRRNEEARKRFASLKAQHYAEKLKQSELVWLAKRKMYAEGRAQREAVANEKKALENLLHSENQKRYRQVRGTLRLGNEKMFKRKTDITRTSRIQYQQRVEAEEKTKAALEHKIRAMEVLEMELINKLKYSQIQEQEATKQLEQVAKGKSC